MPFADFKKPVSFRFDSVIWDWNGTLLNDLDLCIDCINILLKKRGLPLLTAEKYKEIFSFPVIDYYQKAGFDFSKEDFSVPALEFISLYNTGVRDYGLHGSVVTALNLLKNSGKRQFILSAMHQDLLNETLAQNQIEGFFERVYGLGDHYAVSKIERGTELIQDAGLEKEKTCLVGDTQHDFEVASALGLSSILIADGHQSKKRLKQTGAPVFDSLDDFCALVSGKMTLA